MHGYIHFAGPLPTRDKAWWCLGTAHFFGTGCDLTNIFKENVWKKNVQIVIFFFQTWWVSWDASSFQMGRLTAVHSCAPHPTPQKETTMSSGCLSCVWSVIFGDFKERNLWNQEVTHENHSKGRTSKWLLMCHKCRFFKKMLAYLAFANITIINQARYYTLDLEVHTCALTTLMLMFGGSTDPRTLSSVGLMLRRKIFQEKKKQWEKVKRMRKHGIWLTPKKKRRGGRGGTHSPPQFSTLASIRVSNLMGDSGLKWTWSAVFPPLGTTPSDGVTTRPGTAQMSCTWLRWTVEAVESVYQVAKTPRFFFFHFFYQKRKQNTSSSTFLLNIYIYSLIHRYSITTQHIHIYMHTYKLSRKNTLHIV